MTNKPSKEYMNMSDIEDDVFDFLGKCLTIDALLKKANINNKNPLPVSRKNGDRTCH